MTTPNAIDLTWLAAVKSRAEVTSNADDGDIQDAITALSQWLVNWCGRTSLNSLQSFNEIYDGNGNQRLFLRNSPVQAVSSVTINGIAIPLSVGFNVWGVFVDALKRSIALRGGMGNFSTFPYPNGYSGIFSNRGPAFYRGVGNIQVQYQAGYLPVMVTNEVDVITAQTIKLQLGPWVADGGVLVYPSLVPFVLVANSPAAGQYAVSSGLYVFNAADN